MPDRPTYRPVYKALHRPLTVCGVDRRLFFLALLLGRRHVQPVLLVPRRPADVRRPLRLRALGDEPRSGDAADPPRVVQARRPLRPRQARPRRRGGASMVSVGRILRDYRDAGSVNSAARALGLRRRHDVPDEGRPRRRRLSPARRRLRGPDARAAPGPRPPLRGGAAPARRALPRLPVPAQAHGRSVRRRALRRSRSRTRRSSAARPT